MAYHLRKTKRSKGIYLQIYESYRDPERKQARSRHIKTLGYVDSLRSLGIDDPISFYEEAVKTMNDKRNNERKSRGDKMIRAQSPVKWIGFFVVAALFEKLKLRRDLDLFRYSYPCSFSLADCLKAMLEARFVDPETDPASLGQTFSQMWNHPDFSSEQIQFCLEFLGKEYRKIFEIFACHLQISGFSDSIQNDLEKLTSRFEVKFQPYILDSPQSDWEPDDWQPSLQEYDSKNFLNPDLVRGWEVVDLLCQFFEQVFQTIILNNKFSRQEIRKFVQTLKVVKAGPLRFVNFSVKCAINDFLSTRYFLPINLYELSQKQSYCSHGQINVLDKQKKTAA